MGAKDNNISILNDKIDYYKELIETAKLNISNMKAQLVKEEDDRVLDFNSLKDEFQEGERDWQRLLQQKDAINKTIKNQADIIGKKDSELQSWSAKLDLINSQYESVKNDLDLKTMDRQEHQQQLENI